MILRNSDFTEDYLDVFQHLMYFIGVKMGIWFTVENWKEGNCDIKSWKLLHLMSCSCFWDQLPDFPFMRQEQLRPATIYKQNKTVQIQSGSTLDTPGTLKKTLPFTFYISLIQLVKFNICFYVYLMWEKGQKINLIF